MKAAMEKMRLATTNIGRQLTSGNLRHRGTSPGGAQNVCTVCVRAARAHRAAETVEGRRSEVGQDKAQGQPQDTGTREDSRVGRGQKGGQTGECILWMVMGQVTSR